MNKKASALIANNKRALRDFMIFDKYESGITLKGYEVKSLRNHKVNFKDSYARLRNGEIYLHNMNISPYSRASSIDIDPKRPRKLLLHKKEIKSIEGKLTDTSLTIIPLSLYFSKNRVKVELAIAKGKSKRDKRNDMVKKEHDREISRALKKF